MERRDEGIDSKFIQAVHSSGLTVATQERLQVRMFVYILKSRFLFSVEKSIDMTASSLHSLMARDTAFPWTKYKLSPFCRTLACLAQCITSTISLAPVAT